MNITQRLKIRKNYTLLLNDLLVEDIIDNLYSKGVIELDDMQRVRAEVTDKDKAKSLIGILYTKEGSYEEFIKEVKAIRSDLYQILEKTNIEKELESEKQSTNAFLQNVFQRRFIFSAGELVTEDDMIEIVAFEYWKAEKGGLPPTMIQEMIQRISFETTLGDVKRIMIHQHDKTIWAYSNVELKPLGALSAVKTDGAYHSATYSGDEDTDDIDDADDKDTKKALKELNTADLKLTLAPCFQNEGIEEKYLEVFDKEKIDGEMFESFLFNEIHLLFADMPYGDKKRLIKIKNSLMEEYGKKVTPRKRKKRDWVQKLRMFREDSALYRKGSIVRVTNLSESDLNLPLHSFRHTDDHDELSLIPWIAMETSKFAGACLTDRRNGTIHFGISHIRDTDDCQEGKIVGLQIDMPNFFRTFYDEIKQYFYNDQIDIAFRCLPPPKLISVCNPAKHDKGSLFVVEVDVAPIYELTHYDTFYVREKNEKDESVSRIYSFHKNIPTVLLKEDLKKYMAKKSLIAQKRKEIDIHFNFYFQIAERESFLLRQRPIVRSEPFGPLRRSRDFF